MIMDKQNRLSESQLLTTTDISDNVIDLGADSSKVQALVERAGELFCQVDVSLTGGTSLQVVVQVDDDVAFGSPTILYSTAVIVAADLVAGYQFRVAQLPVHISERYLSFNYVISGTFSAGSVVAGIVLDKQTNGMD